MMKRAIQFMFDNSLLLMIGAVAAMIWANVDYNSYHRMLTVPLFHLSQFGAPENSHRVFDLHYLVNDVLMVLFFAMAGREVWIAMLPGGDLHHFRRAALPIMAAVGGMAGPAILFLLGSAALGRFDELHKGWAIPTATDIAFSYLIARIIFGRHHPAVTFLLLLAIVDDALGLVVLAVFYPQQTLHLGWLLLSAAAVAISLGFYMLRIRHYVWYLLIPGTLSWLGFALAGLHPALGVLPIVPLLPHIHLGRVYQGWDFVDHSDMHAFEHHLRKPVEVILGLFGLFNAGVPLLGFQTAQLGVAALVLGGLMLGKPLGILATVVASARLLGLRAKLSRAELLVVGLVAGIGFTVALFVVTVAFEPGPVSEAARLGAVVSFVSGLFAWLIARLLGIRRLNGQSMHEPTSLPKSPGRLEIRLADAGTAIPHKEMEHA